MESEAASTARGQGKAPPYHSYSAFSTFIRDLNTNGIPPRIDRGTMAGVPETVRSQVMTGLRFLGLITSTDEPTPVLRELVSAYETDRWGPALAGVLRTAYAEFFKLDLMTVSAVHLLDAFKPYANSDEVRRKCFVFFLAAAKEAGIPLGSRLTIRQGRGSGLPTQRRHKKASRRETANGTREEPPPPQPPPPPAGNTTPPADLVNQLVGKFPAFDPAWPDDIKAKWFAGFQQFMSMAQGKPSKE